METDGEKLESMSKAELYQEANKLLKEAGCSEEDGTPLPDKQKRNEYYLQRQFERSIAANPFRGASRRRA
jgi:hypothetical protein